MRGDAENVRARSGATGTAGRGRSRVGHRPGRRQAGGPRPVRPAVPMTAVRPAEPRRPMPRSAVAWPDGVAPVAVRPGAARPGAVLLAAVLPGAVRRWPTGPVLPRRAVEPLVEIRFRVRRVVAELAVVLITAAVVVGLGLLADAVSAAHAPQRTVTGDAVTTVDVLPGQVAGRPLG